jgi:ATP-dependent DNA helicase RecG
LEPIYSSTEKLKARALNGRQIGKLTAALLPQISEKDLPENIPVYILEKLKLTGRYKAFCDIHIPRNLQDYEAAVNRLKFEEFFFGTNKITVNKITAPPQQQRCGV